MKTHVIKINISDNGEPPLWCKEFALVYINVFNENDNKPLFNSTHLVVFIKETNEKVQVAKMVANDKDSGPMIYSIVTGYLNADMFEIDSNKGNVTNKVPLDYEQHSSLQFLVEVSEYTNATASSTITVQVNLIDINDNRPILSQLSYSVVVPMDSSYVVKIEASDKDSGINGELTYEVNKPDIFQVDNNGYISVKNISLLKYVNREYVTVTVRDKGFPVNLSVVASVFITLNWKAGASITKII